MENVSSVFFLSTKAKIYIKKQKNKFARIKFQNYLEFVPKYIYWKTTIMNYINRICLEECNKFIHFVLSESVSNRSVILSIQPEFADKIFNHTKKYEYRKVMFSPDVKKVYVYASDPISKIIGYFTIEDILQGSPSTVWKKTSKQSGITKKYYDEYFNGHDKAYAIKIKSTKRFKKAVDPQSIIKDFRPPQNFMYHK